MTATGAPAGGQTVLQGVAAATVLNVASRLVLLARQVVITASFGLAGELDAFYAALSFLTLFLVVFEDAFDAVVVPALVRRIAERGAAAGLDLAAAVGRRTLAINAALVAAALAVAPLAPWLVPGLSAPAKRGMVSDILLLAPYALTYLPYVGLGAFFRAQRRFHAFFAAELVVALLALAALVPFRHDSRALALSLSVAQVAGFAFLALWARRRLAFRFAGPAVDLGDIARAGVVMLPVFASSQALVVVDRFYASFLGEGSLSALYYGLMLVSVAPWLFGTRSTLATSFADGADRGALLARFFSGVLLLATPLTLFAMLAPADLVRFAFGRGQFDENAVVATAAALRWYALGIPALFAWPACVRLLQAVGRYDAVRRLALLAVALNALLGGVVVFALELGVAGLAGVTSLVLLLEVPLALLVLARHGIRVPLGETAGLLPAVALAGSAASLLVLATPLAGAPVAARGALFVVAFAVVALSVPSGERDRVGEVVAYSFPRLGSLWPGRRSAA